MVDGACIRRLPTGRLILPFVLNPPTQSSAHFWPLSAAIQHTLEIEPMVDWQVYRVPLPELHYREFKEAVFYGARWETLKTASDEDARLFAHMLSAWPEVIGDLVPEDRVLLYSVIVKE